MSVRRGAEVSGAWDGLSSTGARSHAKRTVSVGSATYRLKSGGSATLRIRISRALLAELVAAGRRGMTVSMTVPATGRRPAARTVRIIPVRPVSRPPRARAH